jgi:aryl-alcohol dehydrogenase-like predicted oxidoreductase
VIAPRTRIGTSELEIFPLSLGGNTFGWTSNEAESFAVLDAYVAGGGNFIDSADVYSSWVPGNRGGESETIIGSWIASRKNRDQVIVATKVGSFAEAPGASRANILKGVDDSLRRLQTDYIDLYYIHRDDPETPLGETIETLNDLVTKGKVRAIAASNFNADRLAEVLKISDETGTAKFIALQPHDNLVHRKEFEGPLRQVVADHGLSTIPYSSLASGFLTGKYRDGGEADDTSPRAGGARRYLDDRGRKVLAALDAIAAAHDTSVTAVSLAWLRYQPTLAAPIASARVVEQVPDLLASATLELTPDEVSTLTAVSA